MTRHIDIVFDGPPSQPAPRFVEVEDQTGASISIGEWLKREDGYWVLRIPDPREAITKEQEYILVTNKTAITLAIECMTKALPQNDVDEKRWYAISSQLSAWQDDMFKEIEEKGIGDVDD